LYLLTLLGEITTNYLIDLQEYLTSESPKIWQQDITSSYIASTYQLLKKHDEADALITRYHDKTATSTDNDGFNSSLAHNAQYLLLMAKHFPSQALALGSESILHLTNTLFEGNYNTHSAAYSVLALGAYGQLTEHNDLDETIEFVINQNNKQHTMRANASPFLGIDYPVATQAVTINSAHAFYYLDSQSGFDKTLPKLPISQGIEVYRDFLNAEGDVITEFEQGQQLTARLRVRALTEHALDNIAVIDVLPGGFEIITKSLVPTTANWRADYVDLREDRIIYYGRFDSSVKELTYAVKVTASGQFSMPPTYAESMYNRSIRAFSTQTKVTVNPAP
jgi:uncharacterized protein YfaS (alpha-2-macroglobulin family)